MTIRHTYMFLPLMLAPFLCSCVSHIYRFELPEPEQQSVYLHDDSLWRCIVRPHFPPYYSPTSTARHPTVRVEIFCRAARSIIVQDFETEMIWGEKKEERIQRKAGSTSGVAPAFSAPGSVTMLKPQFRILRDSTDMRWMYLDHHYPDFPRNVDTVTLRTSLRLLVDGKTLRIEDSLPLRVESEMRWSIFPSRR